MEKRLAAYVAELLSVVMLNYWLPEISGIQQPAIDASVANGYYNGIQ